MGRVLDAAVFRTDEGTDKKKIEIDKIYEEGYSTKGKDRGYGLALVKKIVDSNDKFENQIEISKTLFSQILSIEI